jgi:hypothetical protein
MGHTFYTVALVVAVGMVAVLALRLLRGFLARGLLKGMPRIQQHAFVDRLREAAFEDPLKLVRALSDRTAGGYLERLWNESKAQVDRAASRLEQSNPAAAARLEAMTETAAAPESLAVQMVRPAEGWILAVVVLPEPERSNESYFVGVAVPEAAAAGEVAVAYRDVRFFVLNKWRLNRNTDLVEETRIGRTVTYNVGTEASVEGFAAGVATRLREGKPKWLAALEARQTGAPPPRPPAARRV